MLQPCWEKLTDPVIQYEWHFKLVWRKKYSLLTGRDLWQKVGKASAVTSWVVREREENKEEHRETVINKQKKTHTHQRD